MRSIQASLLVAFCVPLLSVPVGTTNAFLFNRYSFRGRGILYILMLMPLVIPGIVLGISILVFSSRMTNGLEKATRLYIEALRPGLLLGVLGQFSFIKMIATLVTLPTWSNSTAPSRRPR